MFILQEIPSFIILQLIMTIQETEIQTLINQYNLLTVQYKRQQNMNIGLIIGFLLCVIWTYFYYGKIIDSFEEKIEKLNRREEEFNKQIDLTVAFLKESINILLELKYRKDFFY